MHVNNCEIIEITEIIETKYRYTENTESEDTHSRCKTIQKAAIPVSKMNKISNPILPIILSSEPYLTKQRFAKP